MTSRILKILYMLFFSKDDVLVAVSDLIQVLADTLWEIFATLIPMFTLDRTI